MNLSDTFLWLHNILCACICVCSIFLNISMNIMREKHMLWWHPKIVGAKMDRETTYHHLSKYLNFDLNINEFACCRVLHACTRTHTKETRVIGINFIEFIHGKYSNYTSVTTSMNTNNCCCYNLELIWAPPYISCDGIYIFIMENWEIWKLHFQQI